MAICLRRVVKNYCSFSYQSSRSQLSLIDPRTVPSSSIIAIEEDKNYVVPKGAINIAYRPRSKSLKLSDNVTLESKDWKAESLLTGNGLSYDKYYISYVLGKPVLYCAKECEAYKGNKQKDISGSAFNLPDRAQLLNIQNVLCNDLPQLFEKPLDISIYHENMLFENFLINGRKTRGIKCYLYQINLLKMYSSLKYSSVKFEILKITTHTDSGTVKVRWRIIGAIGYKALAQFVKEKVLQKKEDNESGVLRSFDGFSIYYVRGDGLVHKHTVSKMTPSNVGSIHHINPLATRIATMLGLMSQDVTVPFLKEEYKKYIKQDTYK